MLRSISTKAGYLLLLPVYFLLHNYNELFGFISMGYLLLMALGIYGVAGLIYLIARRFTAHAIFITFCMLLLLLFWGAWHDMIKAFAGKSAVAKYAVALPITIVLLVLFARYFKKYRYLTSVLVILCVMDVISLFLHINRYQHDHNLIYPNKPISSAYQPCHQTDSTRPDIYLLIFDEYTHNRTLQQLWRYDNHDITEWLQQRGFYLPDSSKANYSFTPYSLASMLNMDYLDKKKGDLSEVPYQTLKAVKSMSDNETFNILKKEGYKEYFIGPFNNSFENLNVYGQFTDFAQNKLFNHTLPGRIVEDLGWMWTTPTPAYLERHKFVPEKKYTRLNSEYEMILSKIKATANTTTDRPPQFVYGHSMITHKPHLYDERGQVRLSESLHRGLELHDSYINQVRKANQKIKELVTHIQSHNRKNTIIIIMGDHGFRHYPNEPDYLNFPNFCAIYFPNKTYTQVPRNMSAVNTFRIVFNQYFCQNLKLLKDSSILVKY